MTRLRAALNLCSPGPTNDHEGHNGQQPFQREIHCDFIKSKIAAALAVVTLAGGLAVPTSSAQAGHGWGIGAGIVGAAIVGAAVANNAAYGGGYYVDGYRRCRWERQYDAAYGFLLRRHREGLPGLLRPEFRELRPARTPPAFPSRRSHRPARMVRHPGGFDFGAKSLGPLGPGPSFVLPNETFGGLDGFDEAPLNGGRLGGSARMSEYIL